MKLVVAHDSGPEKVEPWIYLGWGEAGVEESVFVWDGLLVVDVAACGVDHVVEGDDAREAAAAVRNVQFFRLYHIGFGGCSRGGNCMR